MIHPRSAFGFILLSLFFLSSGVLAWLFSSYELPFSSSPTVILMVGEEKFPLLLGNIPMSIVFLAAAFFWLYMTNEFFGKGSALLLALAGGISLAALGGWLKVAPWFPENNFPIDFNQTALFSVMGALVVGGIAISVLYEFFRSLTHNRGAFLRIILASLPGFLFAALASQGVLSWEALLKGEWAKPLAGLITATAQLWLLIILSLPFFYTARFLFVPLVGKKHYEQIKAKFARKPLFKPAEKDFFEVRQEIQGQRI